MSTIALLLGVIAGLAGHAGQSWAAPPVPVQPAKGSTGRSETGTALSAETESLMRQVRARSSQLLHEHGQPVDDEQANNQLLMEIQTRVPTRDELFTLRSEGQTILDLDRLFRERDPNLVISLPTPSDPFALPNSPWIGPNWLGNSRTGRTVADKAATENEPNYGQATVISRKGEMLIRGEQAVYPKNSKPEAVITSETIGSPDQAVALKIKLGDDQASLGLIVRAQDPTIVTLAKLDSEFSDIGEDQLEANTFYFAVASATQIQIGKHEAGPLRDDQRAPAKTTILATFPVSPLREFQLTVYLFKDALRVYRDETLVGSVTDSSIKLGNYAGFFGYKAGTVDTFADNFLAMRYGGPFETKTYAASARGYASPRITHRTLYFEQIGLERYGHHLGNLFAPAIAHAKFFADLAFLPYSIGKNGPNQLHTDLGLASPGEVVLPFRVHYPEPDKRGIAAQAAVLILSFSLLP